MFSFKPSGSKRTKLGLPCVRGQAGEQTEDTDPWFSEAQGRIQPTVTKTKLLFLFFLLFLSHPWSCQITIHRKGIVHPKFNCLSAFSFFMPLPQHALQLTFSCRNISLSIFCIQSTCGFGYIYNKNKHPLKEQVLGRGRCGI